MFYYRFLRHVTESGIFLKNILNRWQFVYPQPSIYIGTLVFYFHFFFIVAGHFVNLHVQFIAARLIGFCAANPMVDPVNKQRNLRF
jgi:hypothetical protein